PSGSSGFYDVSTEQTVWVAPDNVEGSGADGRTATLRQDGTFSVTFNVPAYAEGVTYSVYTSKAHALGTGDPSQDAVGEIAYAETPQPAATTTTLTSSAASITEGDEITLTATVAPAGEGTVSFVDGENVIGD